MTRKTTISLRPRTYAYPREVASFDVPAYVEGDLAVHRPVFWGSSKDAPTEHKGWTITHVPSGLVVAQALPARLMDRRTARISGGRAELLAFAKAWQEACPEFFDLIRTDWTPGVMRANAETTQRAIDIAKGL